MTAGSVVWRWRDEHRFKILSQKRNYCFKTEYLLWNINCIHPPSPPFRKLCTLYIVLIVVQIHSQPLMSMRYRMGSYSIPYLTTYKINISFIILNVDINRSQFPLTISYPATSSSYTILLIKMKWKRKQLKMKIGETCWGSVLLFPIPEMYREEIKTTRWKKIFKQVYWKNVLHSFSYLLQYISATSKAS